MEKEDLKAIIHDLAEETLRNILIDVVNDIYQGNKVDRERLELIIDANR